MKKIISTDRITEKEIYITDFPTDFNPNYGFLYPFLRQGLFQYFKDEKYKSVLLPSFCPEGIYDPFLKLGYDIFFYDIDANGYLDVNCFRTKTDIFVYIHYFGIYNEENINIIKKNLPKDVLFIEDFAHSIKNMDSVLTGDLCTFSYTKMFGVIEGSSIYFNKQTYFKPCNYHQINFIEYRIRASLVLYQLINKINIISLRKIFYASMYIFKLNRYYDVLMSSYLLNYPNIDKKSMKILSCLDFNKIDDKRKTYALLYLKKLNPNLLLDIPQKYYIIQSLFAFPIRVKNQEKYLTALKSKGITALTLKNKWWFNHDSLSNKELYNTHLLLPINHNLNESDILYVIDRVNTIYYTQAI